MNTNCIRLNGGKTMKKNKLYSYPELIKKHDKSLKKSYEKFTKSIKQVRKSCDKYDDSKSKAEFLYHMGIINEYDWHVIRNGIIMYEEKQLKRNLEKVKRNTMYGTLTTNNNTEPITSKSIVENIDESSMYPTRMINIEIPKPTSHVVKVCDKPTAVKANETEDDVMSNTSTINMMETEYKFGFANFLNSNYPNRDLRSFNKIVNAMHDNNHYYPELNSVCVTEIFDSDCISRLLDIADVINKCVSLMRRYAPFISYNQMEQRADRAYGEFLSETNKAIKDNNAVKMRRAIITLFMKTSGAIMQTVDEVDTLMCMTGNSTLTEVIKPKLKNANENLHLMYNSTKYANDNDKIYNDSYRKSMREPEPDDIFYDGPEDPGNG